MQMSHESQLATFRPQRWKDVLLPLILSALYLMYTFFLTKHAWGEFIQGSLEWHRILHLAFYLVASACFGTIAVGMISDYRHRAQGGKAMWLENGYLCWREMRLEKVALNDIRAYKFEHEKSRLSGLTLYQASGKSVFISFFGINPTQELVTQLRACTGKVG